jgi:prepilin-type processing-associated H-X9-DG protein
VSGWNAFDNLDVLVCPSDLNPGQMPILNDDGTQCRTPMSAAMNLDLLIKGAKYQDITRPDRLSLFFDGNLSGEGGGGIQGAYHSSRNFAEKALSLRHSEHANVLFTDWHVESLDHLEDDQIAYDGDMLVTTPGGGNSGNGGSGGGSSNGNGGGNGSAGANGNAGGNGNGGGN